MRINKIPIVTRLRILYGSLRSIIPFTIEDQPEISRIVPGNAQITGAREEQQDAFGFSEIGEGNSLNRIGVLAVLADGMGGLQMGREAGHLAVQTMLKEFSRLRKEGEPPSEPAPQTLWNILEMVNNVVYETARDKGLAFKIGTTLVVTMIFHNQLFWVSVGDSRIYLYRNKELSQLNVEHIYARELEKKVLLNEITPESALLHPEREALTSYVGMPELLEVDRNIRGLPLQVGDKVMLCSDGLYRCLSLKEIKEDLDKPSAEAAEALVQRVVEKGKPAQDNTTVAILACE